MEHTLQTLFSSDPREIRFPASSYHLSSPTNSSHLILGKTSFFLPFFPLRFFTTLLITSFVFDILFYFFLKPACKFSHYIFWKSASFCPFSLISLLLLLCYFFIFNLIQFFFIWMHQFSFTNRTMGIHNGAPLKMHNPLRCNWIPRPGVKFNGKLFLMALM